MCKSKLIDEHLEKILIMKINALNYTNNTININDLNAKTGSKFNSLFLDQAQNLEKMIIIFF